MEFASFLVVRRMGAVGRWKFAQNQMIRWILVSRRLLALQPILQKSGNLQDKTYTNLWCDRGRGRGNKQRTPFLPITFQPVHCLCRFFFVPHGPRSRKAFLVPGASSNSLRAVVSALHCDQCFSLFCQLEESMYRYRYHNAIM